MQTTLCPVYRTKANGEKLCHIRQTRNFGNKSFALVRIWFESNRLNKTLEPLPTWSEALPRSHIYDRYSLIPKMMSQSKKVAAMFHVRGPQIRKEIKLSVRKAFESRISP